MLKIAIYGKGGIGKSTVTSNLAAAFAAMGKRVIQIGCDPKADSTINLLGGEPVEPVMNFMRRTDRDPETLEEISRQGFGGVLCIETGGPTPGLGCAGRGIIATFQLLEDLRLFETWKPDVVLYDVLGDVVCGGFAAPIREGYAEKVLIVTSGEKMALYAANNISSAVRNFEDRSYAKVFGMAMRAMRRDTVGMIFNGDGQATNEMFGVKTAKNMAGSTIYASLDVDEVGPDLLTELMFAYGGDEELGGNCRLYLNKMDLLALGKLRGTNEKRRLFDIVPDAGNPNTGTIREGGTIVPYSISSKLTALSASTQGAAAIQTMVYGDPMNYELGLFGAYTVRVDESVKAVERMLTILGDAMVGGNLIVDKGFVVATLPKSSG